MRETTRHREAYAAYLALGAERSIERLHAELAAAGRTPSLRTLYEWSRCFHWQDRLAAFEHRARAAAEEAELEAIREMHARQVTEALLLQQKGAAWLQGVAADAASPEAAIRAITEGARLERLVRGVPTERTEAVDATTARVEGLADDALDRLLQLAEGAVGGKEPPGSERPVGLGMTHRAMAGRPLQHLPALAAIARDPSPLVVIQKAAQVGATELCVNQALWAADSGYAGRGHVLFLMPTQNQMDDFTQARFDRALQDSPYLRARLQPEPPRRKGADSKRLKRIGPGYLFLRGADSRRQIASVDADLVVLDEVDQMAEGAFELAQKRLASSQAGRLIVASTPRFPEAGGQRALPAVRPAALPPPLPRLRTDAAPDLGRQRRLRPGPRRLSRLRGRDGRQARGGVARRGARQHRHPRLSPQPPLQSLGQPRRDGPGERRGHPRGPAGVPQQ